MIIGNLTTYSHDFNQENSHNNIFSVIYLFIVNMKCIIIIIRSPRKLGSRQRYRLLDQNHCGLYAKLLITR